MANELVNHDPEAGSGFSLTKGRLLRGSFLKWADATGWLDRDGLKPPSPMLVLATDDALQKWKDNKAEVIRDKPLPNPDDLNAAIPQSEWERGIDGEPRKPWSHVVVVYLVNIVSGELYTYIASTTGAHVCFDTLNESIMTMQLLRGSNCTPLVNLSDRPMKTSFGMRKRPHFEIVDWKTPGGGPKAVPVQPATPQLSGPAEATPAPANKPSRPVAKPAVKLASETLNAMGNVKPATTGEVLNDEIPW
jgi:hypothetical protein